MIGKKTGKTCFPLNTADSKQHNKLHLSFYIVDIRRPTVCSSLQRFRNFLTQVIKPS